MKDESTQQPDLLSKKAVALKYVPGESEAPVVVAKGRGKVAEAILDKARENGVAVQEDAALVEVLSKLDLDEQIPAELYQLVAEVLTYVYRADRLASGRKENDSW
ncbi:EscU/YscU/HrcU family type III secretion system export apparatus switch protein [Paenibacillus amylolyticus]|nr:EscU/YscU/HrcU family type III secretion system export apparatus switch protein [Paenibacillus amylolyticus]WFR61840.1 EscU/YscU/HrcU family type III secretion system export apparatus switch protein [Paenibacillus amylolyticus]